VTRTHNARDLANTGHAAGRWMVGVAVALAITTCAVYWGVSRNDFVYYDDDAYVTENYWVRQGLSWEGVKWAFTSFDASNWHPLTWLSHMLDIETFGMKPAGHHLVNVGFHVANVLLLLGLLCYATGRFWASVFVAGLFALHPLHVESVAWVAERKDVLSAFFWLATIWAYAWYIRRPRAGRYATVLACLALGLMSKPMLVTLPIVLLIMDYWPLERIGTKGASIGRLLAEKVPMFAMAAGSAAVTMMAQRSAIGEVGRIGIGSRLMNAIVSYCVYLRQAIWPAKLAAFYPYPERPLYAEAATGLLALAAISAAVVWAGRRHRYLVTGWLWYVVTLIPVIGIIQVGDQAHADRYTYIPLIGVFVIIAWGAGDIVKARPSLQKAVAVVAAVVLVAAGAAACKTVSYWKDDIALFGRAVAVTEGSYTMKAKLGDALFAAKRYDEALVQLEGSLRIKPDARTHAMMGAVYHDKGQLAQAMECYQRALAMDPGIMSALINAAQLVSQLGRYEEAEQYVRRAVAADPHRAATYSFLGQLLAAQAKREEASQAFEKGLTLDPQNVDMRCGLALVLAELGRKAEAIEQLKRAMVLAPDNATIREYYRRLSSGD
jgi:Tfp pilus assembly protein PilF